MSQIQKNVKTKKSIKENMMPQQAPAMNQVPQMGMTSLEQEPQMQSWDHPGCEDKIGKVFVVLKPSPESSADNLVHETHAFGIGQFEPSSVHGLYADKNEANLVAEAAQADLHTHLRKVEKKKDHVLDEITKSINKLQKAVNGHMTEASEKPEEADMHHELAQRKMNIIKGLRDKHKAVKTTKKELPEIKAVSYTHLTLPTILRV